VLARLCVSDVCLLVVLARACICANSYWREFVLARVCAGASLDWREFGLARVWTGASLCWREFGLARVCTSANFRTLNSKEDGTLLNVQSVTRTQTVVAVVACTECYSYTDSCCSCCMHRVLLDTDSLLPAGGCECCIWIYVH
jgi:hypothetical protein